MPNYSVTVRNEETSETQHIVFDGLHDPADAIYYADRNPPPHGWTPGPVTPEVDVYTAIIAWGEPGYPATPLGTISRPGPSTDNVAEAAKEWCQEQLNREHEDVMPPLDWQHYLSRGTGPATSHYIAKTPDGETFQIWFVGDLDR